ncbi:MAG TPA: ribonuclease H [Candidatus Binataceae bacterium]|jgi:ribonuclease HI|nr:ribonuclease H [Candidatus Binataceae bacterium]
MTSHRDREPEILVYADGSCLGNPGPGGWGVVIIGRDGTREYSGGDPQTTNNRMELTAAIEGLRHLLPEARVLLRSDSQYLVNTINSRWKRNVNTDLWKELDGEIARRKVRFEWVRGHAGDALNDRADRLALQAAKDAADAGRALARGAPTQLKLEPTRAASPTAAPPSTPPPLPQDEATLNVLRPLLKEGEVVRRCIHCGGKFVAPERYKDSYCALIACQLERRSRPA